METSLQALDPRIGKMSLHFGRGFPLPSLASRGHVLLPNLSQLAKNLPTEVHMEIGGGGREACEMPFSSFLKFSSQKCSEQHSFHHCPLGNLAPFSIRKERKCQSRNQVRDSLVLERSPESKLLASPDSSYHMARKAV